MRFWRLAAVLKTSCQLLTRAHAPGCQVGPWGLGSCEDPSGLGGGAPSTDSAGLGRGQKEPRRAHPPRHETTEDHSQQEWCSQAARWPEPRPQTALLPSGPPRPGEGAPTRPEGASPHHALASPPPPGGPPGTTQPARSRCPHGAPDNGLARVCSPVSSSNPTPAVPPHPKHSARVVGHADPPGSQLAFPPVLWQ